MNKTENVVKRILVLLILPCLILSFSSCRNETPDTSVKEGMLVSGGYSDIYPNAAVNLKTEKIHMNPECYHVKNIDAIDLDYIPFAYAEYYSDKGYTFCKSCSKNFAERYEEQNK
jgi:hypothetical protein